MTLAVHDFLFGFFSAFFGTYIYDYLRRRHTTAIELTIIERTTIIDALNIVNGHLLFWMWDPQRREAAEKLVERLHHVKK